MTPKRKHLLLSIAVVPLLFGVGVIVDILAPKPAGAPPGMSGVDAMMLVVTIFWMWFGPAYFAARYAKELGMPSGIWGITSIFFPVILPAILAAFSQPPLPPLTPDTIVAGKPVRDWNLGDPVKAYNTKQFLGRGGHTLVVTTQGLVGDHPAIRGGVAWSQTKEIYQNLRDQYVNGMHTARVRQYDLVLMDGRKIRIDQRYSEIDELGRHLQRQVTTALLAANASRLDQGERITFGPIAIAPSGLSWKSSGLPWSDVAGIGVNAGYLVVTKNAGSQASYAVRHSMETAAGILTRIVGTAQPMIGGGRGIQWKKILANKVPNIYLLITFADVLMTKARATPTVLSGSRGMGSP